MRFILRHLLTAKSLGVINKSNSFLLHYRTNSLKSNHTLKKLHQLRKLSHYLLHQLRKLSHLLATNLGMGFGGGFSFCSFCLPKLLVVRLVYPFFIAFYVVPIAFVFIEVVGAIDMRFEGWHRVAAAHDNYDYNSWKKSYDSRLGY